MFLNRLYPLPLKTNRLKDCLMASLIVFALLFFLQPFGFNTYGGNKLLVSAVFGIITFTCQAFFEYVVIDLLTRHVKRWTILVHALTIITMVLFIGVCNFLYFAYISGAPLRFKYLMGFIYSAFAFGAIITSALMAWNYNVYLRNKMEELLDKNTEEQKDIVVAIHDQTVRGKDLEIKLNDFLYAEAQKNNVRVCYMKDGEAESKEIRSTLTSILNDLPYKNVFQCHRSFLVNVNNITAAKGNSNGYQLQVGNCKESIPVSRTYVPKLKAFIG